ncbi:hypothetical protein [Prosthecobacter dejongeii]|uniref:GYF domain-containing protein n=1 Tax=Prosthecobacter dejongeii TaxID=48465 RepID=A0A7W7YLN8_9BACT|nr:hypothetical protein [Prosthecobacter dejongeii]MBB5038235.1 hypothetical protein [Prosthecobacter dejongeii]
MKSWWLCRDGVVHGPYDQDTVHRWLNEGEIFEGDQLAEVGTEAWQDGRSWALKNDESFLFENLLNEIVDEMRAKRVWRGINNDSPSPDFRWITLKESMAVTEYLNRTQPGWSANEKGEELYFWESDEMALKVRVALAKLFPEKLKAKSRVRYQ